MVGKQIGQRLHPPIRPEDLCLIDPFMFTQPKMDAKVVLRQVAAAADHFAKLHKVPRCRSHPCIQSQAITLDALQLKADPVVPRAALGTQNHWPAYQILNHRFELAIVEEVAHGHSTAHLRNLERSPCQLTDVLESSITLIQKQQLRLKVRDLGTSVVHLWIHVSVDQEKILPSIVFEIDEGVSPPHIPSRAIRNPRGH